MAGPLAICTPKELLERGELDFGEVVRVIGTADTWIARVDCDDPILSHRGLYYASRIDPHYPLSAHHLGLRAGGKWEVWSADMDRPDGQGSIPCYFDSLPELLDSLYVVTLKEEEPTPSP